MEEAGILSNDFKIPFITYDIETLQVDELFEGRIVKKQKPISIAYYANESSDVFTGDDLVKRFLDKMNEIQVSFSDIVIDK